MHLKSKAPQQSEWSKIQIFFCNSIGYSLRTLLPLHKISVRKLRYWLILLPCNGCFRQLKLLIFWGWRTLGNTYIALGRSLSSIELSNHLQKQEMHQSSLNKVLSWGCPSLPILQTHVKKYRFRNGILT